MAIPIGAKKSSDKTAFFHYKNSQQKIKIAVNFFYLIKRIHQNSIANSVLNDEQRIPLKSGTRAGALLIIVLEVQASCSQIGEKGIKMDKSQATPSIFICYVL